MLCIVVSYTASNVTVDSAVQKRHGFTALYFASGSGYVECARLLLDRGAGVDVVSVSSWLAFRMHRVAWALLCDAVEGRICWQA